MNDNISDYIDYLTLERRYSVNTVISYKEEIVNFNNFIKKDLLNVNYKDINSYLKYLTNNKLSEKTISHYITCLKEFYRFLELNDLIDENPLEYISLPKMPKN